MAGKHNTGGAGAEVGLLGWSMVNGQWSMINDQSLYDQGLGDLSLTIDR
jgi:hypothetical protein